MGYKKRGKQDGTGPYKDSWMARQGRIGKRAGRQKGGCK